MRAWTIVIFILAIHACLAMINIANITNVGLNVTLDTSGMGSNIVVTPGGINMSMPSSDPRFFNESATSPSEIKGTNATLIKQGDFIGDFIESITGVGRVFLTFMATFSTVIFSIHAMAAPYFGDTNAWVLEGMVDTIFGVALFQMVTGRSFKTME
jgi:hypothetical protein